MATRSGNRGATIKIRWGDAESRCKKLFIVLRNCTGGGSVGSVILRLLGECVR